MFETIYSQLVLAAAVLVVIFAFWKGDEPERMGAAAYAMVFLAATMIRDATNLSFPRWGVMGLEVVLLVVFVGIAWHSRRAWPVWAASFQALIVTCHAAYCSIESKREMRATSAKIALAAVGDEPLENVVNGV